MANPNYRYKFYCKRCGHYEEHPTKQDVAMAKLNHKLDKCDLLLVPHKNMFIYTRRKLAEEVLEGYRIDKAEKENYAKDSTDSSSSRS